MSKEVLEELDKKGASRYNSLEVSEDNIETGRKDMYKELLFEDEKGPHEDRKKPRDLGKKEPSSVDSYLTYKFKKKGGFSGFNYEEKSILVDKDNRVLIPKKIRDKEGIGPGDRIKLADVNGEIILEKVSDRSDLKAELREGYKKSAEEAKRINKEIFSATREVFEDT